MYRCIVAPVDGSAFGEHALPLAAGIARRFGATLHLAHVHVPLVAPSGVETVAFRGDWTDIAKEQEKEYLDGLAARLAEMYGVRVEPILVDGPVADALEEHTRSCRAGLVVMSSHGHLRFRRLWHHGVAEHIARRLPIPVLLARPRVDDEQPVLGADAQIRHILIPLDGTSFAEGILEHALAVGRPFRARYTLVRVVPPDAGSGRTLLAPLGPSSGIQPLTRTLASARQYLNAVAERLRASGRDVTVHVEVAGDVAAAILKHVHAPSPEGTPVDLIAMEMHPHRPVSRIVAAHTADRVLHGSSVPVLLFEPPAVPLPGLDALSAEVPLGA